MSRPENLFGLARTVLVVSLLGFRAEAVQSPVSQFDVQDYETAASSAPWAKSPSSHHQLFLDVYNVTDLFDSETGGAAGFADQTLLADTLRPTATVLWDDRFRIQLGVIAEKIYGDSQGFHSVDPWVQLLWKPVETLSVVIGDLDIPHYFLPALFYPTNYFMQNINPAKLPPLPQTRTVPSNFITQSPVETGAQLILKKPFLYDDFYYNYRELDTSSHNEKFDLGFVHRNTWKWLYVNYQAHWIHYGGELDPHPIETRNDVAQAAGLGLEFHPWDVPSLMVGGGYSYLHSHLRQDASNPAYLIPSTDGNGHLWQAFARWGRIKLIYGDWRGHDYYHEGGDPMFILPVMDMATIRWDILLSRDFNLYAETTGYFIGNNNLGYDHDVKAAFHIQASWQFSIPVAEWTSPAASPEGQPIPARWDYGI